MIFDANPMKYILSRQILGGHYLKWVVILSEFDFVFSNPKAKKSLVFVEIMVGLPQLSQTLQELESLPDDSLFLMDLSDPWYRDILVYLQTQCFRPSTKIMDAFKENLDNISTTLLLIPFLYFITKWNCCKNPIHQK